MASTKQQQHVIDTLLREDVSLVLVPACAGSGKTHTLIQIAKDLNITNGLYLAYNKAIAEEATTKFKGTGVKCTTTHSLAYASTVRQYGLKVGWFNPRDVRLPRASYAEKASIVTVLNDFLNSSYTDPLEYFKSINITSYAANNVCDHLDLMSTGEIQCPHNFYLKFYHVLLATGSIPPPTVSILMLDEGGDINAVTLEIFKLIQAPKKIVVGDQFQNIYSFNGTINGFKAMAGEGITTKLTQSFRVSAPIALKIQTFMQNNLDSSFEFVGRDYAKDEMLITSKAYIARNNSYLVIKMFELMSNSIPFHTTRPIETLLELPLILVNIDNGKPITNAAYKHIEKLRKYWESNPYLQGQYPKVSKYLVAASKDDEELKRALNVISTHGAAELNILTDYAKECNKYPCNLTLSTGHSSKGLEFSSVELAPDISVAVTKALISIKLEKARGKNAKEVMIKKHQEELLLAYVACSRAMVELIGATEFLSDGSRAIIYN